MFLSQHPEQNDTAMNLLIPTCSHLKYLFLCESIKGFKGIHIRFCVGFLFFFCFKFFCKTGLFVSNIWKHWSLDFVMWSWLCVCVLEIATKLITLPLNPP